MRSDDYFRFIQFLFLLKADAYSTSIGSRFPIIVNHRIENVSSISKASLFHLQRRLLSLNWMYECVYVCVQNSPFAPIFSDSQLHCRLCVFKTWMVLFTIETVHTKYTLNVPFSSRLLFFSFFYSFPSLCVNLKSLVWVCVCLFVGLHIGAVYILDNVREAQE